MIFLSHVSYKLHSSYCTTSTNVRQLVGGPLLTQANVQRSNFEFSTFGIN
jgi:hypothetical protein